MLDGRKFRRPNVDIQFYLRSNKRKVCILKKNLNKFEQDHNFTLFLDAVILAFPAFEIKNTHF